MIALFGTILLTVLVVFGAMMALLTIAGTVMLRAEKRRKRGQQ